MSDPPSPGHLPTDLLDRADLAAPRHNLPLQLTTFVGRERESADVRRLLAEHRLVTLTGPGGTGKTRLALHVAAEAIAGPAGKTEPRSGGPALAPAPARPTRVPAGAWLVDLAPLADPALVVPAIAAATGIRTVPGQPVADAVVAALRARRLLFVLDNCEHLVAACAAAADRLLRECLGVRLLATSREPLGIAGERPWRVPSLSLPPPGTPDGAAAGAADPRAAPATDDGGRLRQGPGDLLRYEAVRLFVERVRVARPDFALTYQNAAAVAELCRRLDGIPLAIELAAARMRVLSVAQLLARLDDRFRLLTGGSRTALERHQTLQATVDWSYALLIEPEQRLFSRLAVFAGGFTLEAAEAVCADETAGDQAAAGEAKAGDDGRTTWGSAAPVPDIRPSSFVVRPEDILDLLTRLVDKSMVLAEPDAAGEIRYRQLETLRQYGREKLAAGGEAEAVQRRHADYFRALAEAAGPVLERGGDQATWLRRLEAERDNLRQALRWLLDHRRVQPALRLATATWRYFDQTDRRAEGRSWLAAALDLPGAAANRAPYADALLAEGHLAGNQRDWDDLERRCAVSLALQRELGDARGAAWSLQALGKAALGRGDVVRARALQAESLALRRASGDRLGESHSLTRLGEFAEGDGDLAAARRHYEACLAIRRECGDQLGVRVTLGRLAGVAQRMGDGADATRLIEEGLAVGRQLEGGPQVFVLRAMALAAATGEERARVRAVLEQELASARAQGAPSRISWLADFAGYVALRQGDLGAARAFFAEDLTCVVQGDPARLGGVIGVRFPRLEGLAVVAAAEGDSERCVRLCGAVDATGGDRSGAPTEWRHLIAESRGRARAALGERAADRAYAEGQAMSAEQAVAYALEPYSPQPEAAGTTAAGSSVADTASGAAEGSANAIKGIDGGTPSVSGAASHRAADVLSERERQVAALVAEALTNNEIAAELVIAASTAARHLEHIRAKLGLRSRIQIAAWATASGLVDQ